MKSQMYKMFGLLSCSAMLMMTIFATVSANDTQLVDQLDQQDNTSIDEMNLEFSQFSSCEDMSQVLDDFLDNFPKRPHYPMYRGGGLLEQADMAVDSVAPTATKSQSIANEAPAPVGSSTTDYSTTNLQKTNVDEPEILKTNGDLIIYKNQQEGVISLIKSPLDIDNATIDMNEVEVVNTITLPKQFHNTQLFLNDDRLIILATRHTNLGHTQETILNRFNRTSVAIYDISDPTNLILKKFTDMDGHYYDARMLDDRLFVLTNVHVNRWYRAEHKDTRKTLTPSAFDITPQGQESITKVAPDCDRISYLLPNKETIEELNLHPSFTLISVIDTADVDRATETNVVLSNQGQIHVSTDSLYLTQNIRVPRTFRCPRNARCIMPDIGDGSQTLIHKFDINNFSVNYRTTNIVKGSSLTQYSMDEDSEGNFRILTRKERREGTNFYAFDEDLQLAGMIDGIEPGEQFKASRYMGDKLYLVTFEQTDPLFVIDIADITNPKIVGELKIPGFSTYLHPMGELNDGKQYLIGLGFDADRDGRQAGLQASLFEVDYTTKVQGGNADCAKYDVSECPNYCTKECTEICPEDEECFTDCSQGGQCIFLGDKDKDYISVRQLDVKTFGGVGSMSEAMHNPRMFVMDADNVVTLPMILQDQVEDGERCNVIRDANGVETKTNCYPIKKNITDFAGLKSLKFDVEDGISEQHSIDYLPLYEKLYKSNNDYGNINSWQIRNGMMRVGYAGDALYMINNDFAHFTIPGNQDQATYLYFDEQLTAKKDTDTDNASALCNGKGGTRLEQYKECEGIDQQTCEANGGTFNECASACRHTDSEVCTMQCVLVCEF